MMLVLSGILQGIVSGVVIAAGAAGMSLIYRVSHVTNFLHGSLLALALYVTLDLSRRFAIEPLYLSIPMVPIMGLVGLALYWTLIRPVRRRHHLLRVHQGPFAAGITVRVATRRQHRQRDGSQNKSTARKAKFSLHKIEQRRI